MCTNIVETADSAMLTNSEQKVLAQCENVIAKNAVAFIEVGNALATIRSGKLYRETYKRFEDYCRERWEFGADHTSRLIGAAEIVGHLQNIDPGQCLPAYEKHVRPLLALRSDDGNKGTPRVIDMKEVEKVWQEVVEKAPRDENGQPRITAELVKETTRRHKAAAAPRSKETNGKHGELTWSFQVGDCQSLPFNDDTFDLVFCSPPYESQRDYDELAFSLSGEAWVEWAAKCFQECLRVCRGLVAWVVEGYTKDFAYSSTPFLLLADLHRAGVKVRKPCVYHRNGIPGTGGPDWLRNDWEPIICATKAGRLPWSDATAMGTPPKQNKPRAATNRHKDGTRKSITYNDPEIVNPGNIISGLVGCGGLGWEDAHENEAPFPEWLAEFFVRSFCPPDGHVLDPFSGSGTTVSVAVRNGRNAIGVDARESQVWLGETRLSGLTVKQRKAGQGLLI